MKNILFDFDGPLFDGRKVARKTLQEVFDELQIPVIVELSELSLSSPEQFVKSCMDRYQVNGYDIQSITEIYYKKLERNEMLSEVRGEVPGILFQLKGKGNRLFIISDRSEQRLRFLLESFKILHFFEDVLGRERYGLKPSQGSVSYLEEMFGVYPENTWMIGDTESDYLYAKRAGYHYAHAAYSSEPACISWEKCDFVLKSEKDILLM